MVAVRRLVLDVLKPHQPSGLDLTKAIAAQGRDYHVRCVVEEIDEQTESVTIFIEGSDIQFEPIARVIEDLGGSVHSVDEIEVHSRDRNR